MTTNFATVARTLQARALTIAKAHLAARRIDPARRWRKPGLLWPLFPKG